jgi:RNA polymerase-interacting CarD/CdnL/TRCF family regulator
MDSSLPYTTGDWVVHLYYGVGQITAIEYKPINGEKQECYKVKTKNSTFWFPTIDCDNPRIRPVVSDEIISKVIYHLRRKAGALETDTKYWKKKIDEVKSNGDILSITKLIRDLSTIQVVRGLNETENNALEFFKERLLREWASSTKEDVEKIRPTLIEHLQVSKAKAEDNGNK